MKTSIKHSWLIFPILLTAFTLVAGCVGFVHHPDPLAGWKRADYNAEPNETIIKDYQDYIQKLPPKQKKYAGDIFFFEDGTGQHAIRISILLDGTEWAHILIYDKQNKRTRVIKYAAGQYRS